MDSATQKSGFTAGVADAYLAVMERNAPLFSKCIELVKKDLENPEGKMILDLGSGPGEPAMGLAQAFPKATVVCSDYEADMVEKAKVRCKDMPNMEFGIVNAEDLSAYPDASIDVVMSCLCLMFVSDKGKGLKELARVLKSKGLAYIIVWKDNKVPQVLKPMMTKLLGGPPPPNPINPMSMSAPGAVENLIEATAGLEIAGDDLYAFDFELGLEQERAFSAAAIPAMPKLLQMETEGRIAVMSEATTIWKEIMIEKGFWSEDNGYVLPQNRVQILTIRKL
eukprot:gnl/MRDRNA2_/MRDRNA2_88179_c0_seq1.p1 gnl/MRDRNA2_/MRDRNA2_88179_c0~~gnl/MRDRNA2_/MRDRNA2_88179_c0_seq1.p1  ORF type:complete len:306 (+),score=82.07 gnl/MRDRNA2_/MRDRNA2_88179_c0_seq1:81-920(+)